MKIKEVPTSEWTMFEINREWKREYMTIWKIKKTYWDDIYKALLENNKYADKKERADDILTFIEKETSDLEWIELVLFIAELLGKLATFVDERQKI